MKSLGSQSSQTSGSEASPHLESRLYLLVDLVSGPLVHDLSCFNPPVYDKEKTALLQEWNKSCKHVIILQLLVISSQQPISWQILLGLINKYVWRSSYGKGMFKTINTEHLWGLFEHFGLGETTLWLLANLKILQRPLGRALPLILARHS